MIDGRSVGAIPQIQSGASMIRGRTLTTSTPTRRGRQQTQNC